MCGIIGFSGKNVTQEHIRVLQKVMIESRIRGMHASGIAWCNNRGNILSVVEPIPIDKLVEEFNWSVFFPKGKIAEEVHLIAHARYSTSDIRFNQPIVGESMAIAHNGVITQSDPKTWEKHYGYKCKTQNDSELLLRAMEANDDIFDIFEGSSMAALLLKSDGELIYFRNGTRPLWFGKIGESTVYASTYDILRRAGVTGITKVTPSDCKELQRRSFYEQRTLEKTK